MEQRFLKDLREKKLKEVVTKHCSSVIKFLMSQKLLSFPFNEPVDTVTYRDYLNYVRTPMDFGTIKSKINQYKTPFEFEADVRLVFENARKYNAPETEVRDMARQLEARFEERWNKHVLPKIEELKVAEEEDQVAFKQSKADAVTIEAETRVDECCRLLMNRIQALSEEINYVQCLAAAECKPLNKHERLRLGWELTALPSKDFHKAMNLIFSRNPGLIGTMKEAMVELDLAKFDCLSLRELQDFVRHCSRDRDEEDVEEKEPDHKRQRKSGIHNEQKTQIQRNNVEWPAVPIGIGIRPYAPEVEPFVPPNSEEVSPTQFYLNAHSSGQSEIETSPGSTPKHIKVEEVSQSAPFSQVPMLPQMSSGRLTEATQGTVARQIPISGAMTIPSSFSVLALTQTRPSDVIQQKLITPSLPECLIPSQSAATAQQKETNSSITVIPLVPVSQPVGLIPSIFTPNLQLATTNEQGTLVLPQSDATQSVIPCVPTTAQNFSLPTFLPISAGEEASQTTQQTTKSEK